MSYKFLFYINYPNFLVFKKLSGENLNSNNLSNNFSKLIFTPGLNNLMVLRSKTYVSLSFFISKSDIKSIKSANSEEV